MRGLNGNEAAQPRVFAHDMVPIAIGAINPRQEGTGASLNGIANGLEMTSGGTGYTAGSTITLDAGGAGTPSLFCSPRGFLLYISTLFGVKSLSCSSTIYLTLVLMSISVGLPIWHSVSADTDNRYR